LKYGVDISISGYLEVEAESKEAAKAKVEDGYSLTNVQVMDDEIDQVYELTPDGHWPTERKEAKTGK